MGVDEWVGPVDGARVAETSTGYQVLASWPKLNASPSSIVCDCTTIAMATYLYSR